MPSPFSSPLLLVSLLLVSLLLPTHLLARPDGGAQKFLTSVNKEGSHKEGANKEGAHKEVTHEEGAHKEVAHKEGAHRGGIKSAAEEPTEDYEVGIRCIVSQAQTFYNRLRPIKGGQFRLVNFAYICEVICKKNEKEF